MGNQEGHVYGAGVELLAVTRAVVPREQQALSVIRNDHEQQVGTQAMHLTVQAGQLVVQGAHRGVVDVHHVVATRGRPPALAGLYVQRQQGVRRRPAGGVGVHEHRLDEDPLPLRHGGQRLQQAIHHQGSVQPAAHGSQRSGIQEDIKPLPQAKRLGHVGVGRDAYCAVPGPLQPLRQGLVAVGQRAAVEGLLGGDPHLQHGGPLARHQAGHAGAGPGGLHDGVLKHHAVERHLLQEGRGGPLLAIGLQTIPPQRARDDEQHVGGSSGEGHGQVGFKWIATLLRAPPPAPDSQPQPQRAGGHDAEQQEGAGRS